MPDFEYYDLNVQGPLAYVTLKRPDRLNTLAWVLERDCLSSG